MGKKRTYVQIVYCSTVEYTLYPRTVDSIVLPATLKPRSENRRFQVTCGEMFRCAPVWDGLLGEPIE
jgi:hypothetical protein